MPHRMDPGDFPQADGQLCDANSHPMPFSGELTVQGIDFYHEVTFPVVEGRFRLYGLLEGRYLLRFISKEFYSEQIFQIPLKLIAEGEEVLGIKSPKKIH